QGPVVVELDDAPRPGAAEAPPVEDADPGAAPGDERSHARAAAVIAATAAAGRRPGPWRWLGWAATGLAGIALWLAVDALVAAVFARWAVAGWLATGLAVLLATGLAGVVALELAALARLGRIDTLRRLAAAGAGGDAAAARDALDGLDRLTAHNAEAAPGRAALAEAEGDAPDPVERLALADRLVLAPLDARARAEVELTARQVAGATAVIPLPVIDVLVVLAANLRMIRRVAAIYGGRAGMVGALRLLRLVAGHLMATGAVAATDELLDPVLGHGVLSTLSRRLGEAALNAALTARVGAAAIEVCRPFPQAEAERIRARSLLLGAIGDWRSRT
ncbi:MAG: TIGR01620 family protein, partial [Pseudomonadota bacterium]